MTYQNPYHLLVADDDADVRRLNTVTLTRCGYKVDAVGDGASAWDAMLRNRYDLLVTDNIMPELTGIELLHRMRAAGSSVPGILVSGTVTLGAHSKGKTSGVQCLHPAATLWKPYAPRELIAIVALVLCATLRLQDPAKVQSA
jgi:CheY-like chemotaxis protein